MKLLPCVAMIAMTLGAPTFSRSAPASARVPVLLELFTSEGCSSCPPADRLLASLDRQPVENAELIVLSEHVDYWNHLGWSDPFSSALFSARQQEYADRLHVASVYTPQLVIDGRLETVGSDEPEVLKAIAKSVAEPKLAVSVRAERSGNGATTAHVEAEGNGRNAELYIAIAEDHAQTHVLRGENSGRMLSHVAVVRSLTRVGKWEGTGLRSRNVPLPDKAGSSANSSEIRVIAILQDPKTGKILGAAQTRVAGLHPRM
jgi:hypothetical protein